MKMNHVFGCIWIGVAVIFTIGLFSGLKSSRRSKDFFSQEIVSSSFGKYTLSDTMNFSMTEVDSIEIDLLSESIFFEETDSKSIIVELYGAPENVPKVDLHKGILKIKSYNKISIMEPKRKVVVKFPSNFDCSLVKIDSVSGSIHLNDCDFGDIVINSTSGSINIGDCKMDTLKSKSISGSVHLADCSINECVIKSTSGSINTSGSSFESLDIHSTSGSIHADLEDPLLNDSQINSTSGSIHLDIPKSSNLQIDYSVTSGNYRNNISGVHGKRGTDALGFGGPTLNLKTTSGSISVN